MGAERGPDDTGPRVIGATSATPVDETRRRSMVTTVLIAAGSAVTLIVSVVQPIAIFTSSEVGVLTSNRISLLMLTENPGFSVRTI